MHGNLAPLPYLPSLDCANTRMTKFQRQKGKADIVLNNVESHEDEWESGGTSAVSRVLNRGMRWT